MIRSYRNIGHMMVEAMLSMKGIERYNEMSAETIKALDGINLEIEEGERGLLLGPSGSGKTTILNLIGGLDVPTVGNIFFKNTKLSSMNRNQMAQYRRKNIGFIFQTYNLFPVYSVYENILFPLLLNGSKEKDARERVMNIINKVGLSDQVKKRPSLLSGGQCQRVAIARA